MATAAPGSHRDRLIAGMAAAVREGGFARTTVAHNTLYAAVGVLGLADGFVVAFRRGTPGDLAEDVDQTDIDRSQYAFSCSLHPGMRGTLVVR